MRIVGLGNALTDVLARLHSDECFDEMGLLKGGMQLIDEEKLLRIMSVFEGLETTLASGGSAANAVSGVARMGIESGLSVHSWVQRLLCAPRRSLPKCSKDMIYCISKGIWYKTLR